MNYRYGLLAVVLAVSSFAAPTLAGVTDTGDGEGFTTNTTTNDHVKIIEKYDGGVIRNDVNYINDKSSATGGGTSVTGTVYVRNLGDIDIVTPDGFTYVGGAGSGGYKYSVSFSSLDAFYSALNSIGSGGGHQDCYFFMSAGQTGSFQGNGNFSAGEYVVGYTSVGADKSSLEKSDLERFKTSEGVAAGDEHVSWGDSTWEKSKTDPDVLDHTDYSATLTTKDGTIMVGDPDDMFNAYCAAGGGSLNIIADKYYNRTVHYGEVTHENRQYVGSDTTYVVNIAKSVTPIVLDLDGDGKIEASNGQYLAHNTFNDSKIALFDFYNNGFPVMTEWVGANDGLLCRPNADGSVNGSNLFGITNGFENGYEEMASLDANNDGQLSGTELQGLKVWTDVNGDAVAQANELKSLGELGITSIKVNHNNYTSTFVRNGKTFKSFDWWPTAKEMRKVDMASVIK